MPSFSQFERSVVEEDAYRTVMKFGQRVFEKRPRGLTVLECLGREAVVATGYHESQGVSRAYVLGRNESGLQVTTHRLYRVNGFDCPSSSCVSVHFMQGVTELEFLDGSDITMISRLHAQADALKFIGEIARQGIAPENDPSVNKAAQGDLQRLAQSHSADELLAEAWTAYGPDEAGLVERIS